VNCPVGFNLDFPEVPVKGIVFNLLEEVVSTKYGESTWDKLLDAAHLEGAYTSLGSYPDLDLEKLVAAAASALNLPADEVVRWFGRAALPLLAERYPAFFEPHSSTRPFVLTLNDIIHPEVRKLYPGADVPTFVFDESSPDSLSITYASDRKLCAFAEGLIEGTATYYGEQASVHQSQCMNRGDAQCILVCSFQSQPSRS
jgi:hypothetical protein